MEETVAPCWSCGTQYVICWSFIAWTREQAVLVGGRRALIFSSEGDERSEKARIYIGLVEWLICIANFWYGRLDLEIQSFQYFTLYQNIEDHNNMLETT